MSIGKVYSYALTATVAKSFPGGRFLRLITSDAAVDIELFDESSQPLGTMVGVKGGFRISVDDFNEKNSKRSSTFGLVKITSATNQTVDVAISRVPIDYDRLTGSVTAEISSGTTVTQSSVTVSSSSAALLASNSNRHKAHIKNTSLTETVYISDDGTAATTSHYPIGPGETHVHESEDGLNAIRGGSVDAVVRIIEERD